MGFDFYEGLFLKMPHPGPKVSVKSGQIHAFGVIYFLSQDVMVVILTVNYQGWKWKNGRPVTVPSIPFKG